MMQLKTFLTHTMTLLFQLESPPGVETVVPSEKPYDYLVDGGFSKLPRCYFFSIRKFIFTCDNFLSAKETIHRAELRLSDIANLLGRDWPKLAAQLEVEESDINIIKSDYPDDTVQQAIEMLRLWVQTAGNKATGELFAVCLLRF